MPAVGGELPTLRALYNELTSAAPSIEETTTKVTTALDNAVWTGPNSDAFRSQWAEFKVTLGKIQQVMVDASLDVKRQNNDLALATGATSETI